MFTTISFLILRTIGKRNFQSDRAILSALELSRIPREFRQYLEVLLAVNFYWLLLGKENNFSHKGVFYDQNCTNAT